MPNPYDPLRRVSDQMLLLMLREGDSKPLCPKRTMEHALAAALLGDLILWREIVIEPHSKDVLLSIPPPATYDDYPLSRPTALDEWVHKQIYSTAVTTVTDWLDMLGPVAIKEVPRRLEALGILYYGGPFFARRWRPIDPLMGIGPVSTLTQVLRSRQGYQGGPTETLLLGLVEATLLTEKLFFGGHYPNLQERIKAYLQTALPSDVQASILTLVSTLQHVVGNAVYTHV